MLMIQSLIVEGKIDFVWFYVQHALLDDIKHEIQIRVFVQMIFLGFYAIVNEPQGRADTGFWGSSAFTLTRKQCIYDKAEVNFFYGWFDDADYADGQGYGAFARQNVCVLFWYLYGGGYCV